MTWDLISLKAHPHRPEGEAAMALMRKSLRRSDKPDASAVQYMVEVCPLPIVVKQGTKKHLVPLEPAQYRVTVDLAKRAVLFDISGADAALPTPLRGGGLGSLAVSELITWCMSHYPDLAVINGRVAATMLDYPNAEANVVRFLKNLGFAVARVSGGLQFEAASVAQLKAHVNASKLEMANPITWAAGLVQDNITLAAQLLEQNQDMAGLKEQLHQVTQTRQSPVPFLGGILAGSVAGIVIAAVLFSI